MINKRTYVSKDWWLWTIDLDLTEETAVILEKEWYEYNPENDAYELFEITDLIKAKYYKTKITDVPVFEFTKEKAFHDVKYKEINEVISSTNQYILNSKYGLSYKDIINYDINVNLYKKITWYDIEYKKEETETVNLYHEIIPQYRNIYCSATGYAKTFDVRYIKEEKTLSGKMFSFFRKITSFPIKQNWISFSYLDNLFKNFKRSEIINFEFKLKGESEFLKIRKNTDLIEFIKREYDLFYDHSEENFFDKKPDMKTLEYEDSKADDVSKIDDRIDSHYLTETEYKNSKHDYKFIKKTDNTKWIIKTFKLDNISNDEFILLKDNSELFWIKIIREYSENIRMPEDNVTEYEKDNNLKLELIKQVSKEARQTLSEVKEKEFNSEEKYLDFINWNIEIINSTKSNEFIELTEKEYKEKYKDKWNILREFKTWIWSRKEDIFVEKEILNLPSEDFEDFIIWKQIISNNTKSESYELTEKQYNEDFEDKWIYLKKWKELYETQEVSYSREEITLTYEEFEEFRKYNEIISYEELDKELIDIRFCKKYTINVYQPTAYYTEDQAKTSKNSDAKASYINIELEISILAWDIDWLDDNFDIYDKFVWPNQNEITSEICNRLKNDPEQGLSTNAKTTDFLIMNMEQIIPA